MSDLSQTEGTTPMRALRKLDEALSLDWEEKKEKPNPESPGQIQSVMNTIAEFATISEILRTCGAMIIVASMSLFLIQGLEVAGDLQRYGTLLLQTVLLTAGGFGLSYILKENKGARVFYGLGLLSVPANFAVLGALVYSLVAAPTGAYPSFAHWVVTDVTATVVTLAAAVAILLPLALFSLRIFARGSEAKLTLALMGASASLLLPVRDAMWVGPIAVAVAIAVIWLIRSSSKSNPLLGTAQGWFVKCVLLIPTLIMLVRSVYLYEFNSLMGLTIAATAFVVMRQISVQIQNSSALRKFLEFVSVPTGFCAAYFVGSLLNVHLDEGFALIAMTLVASGLTLEISTRTRSKFMERFLSVSAMILLAIGLIVVSLTNPTWLFTIATSLLLIGATTAAAMTKRRTEVVTGGIAVAIILAPQIMDLIQAIELNNWVTLSVIGALAVVGGSLLDRHGAAFKLRLEKWFYRAEKVEKT